jgi:hypothetical protein
MNIKKDEHIFYHPIFKRNNLKVLDTIKRKKKGKKVAASKSDEKAFADIIK